MTGSPLRVFLRLRPPSEYELQKRKRRVLEVVDRSTVVVEDGQEFKCHGVFDEGISSDSMYRESCANVPQHLLQGYDCTVVAYGVSGSGRSQTVRDVTKPLMNDVFNALGNDSDLLECSIRCSVVEVYLERLRDLLHEPSTVQLQAEGTLHGCAAVACVSAEDVLGIIHRARMVQTASALVPNAKSNRSTAVIQLSLQQTLRDGTIVTSRLHIIDLLACELARVSNGDSLEATQVSLSLKALQKQIRHFASGRPPIPLSDIPVVAQLLSYSFSSTYLSVFLTASPCATGAESLFKFGTDCKRVKPSSERHRSLPDTASGDPWKILARTLAIECERSGVADNPKLKGLIDRIRNNDLADSKDSLESAGQDHDRIVEETEKVKSERDQLCADLAILQAQSIALNGQNQKMKQDLDRLQAELKTSHFQRHQVEETLRISQFREAEAVVFLRQLRRFYFRLLQTTLSEGTPDTLSMQLVDMDHFMMQSGLLEENEVGGDVSIDCRPSRQSLERSMAERERAAKQARQPIEATPTDDGETVSLDDQPPLPVSVGTREQCEKVEARQKLFKTPAGRYIAMKEQRLEEEIEQLSEINIQLQTRLREAMTNVEALSARGGLAASLDKMRVAQEIRSLKEGLDRKNNDLKAVIWKMNELHMVGKTLQTQSQSKDHHLSHLEQSLLGLRTKHSAAIEDHKNSTSKLQQSVIHLKNQLQSLLVPVWQLSSDRKARSVPLQGRLTIPLTNISVDQHESISLGESGEWAALGVFPGGFDCVDGFTQTDEIEVQTACSQTIESVHVVDRANTTSTEVQTDDVPIGTNHDDQLINYSNIESLMFMMGPDNQMPTVGSNSAALMARNEKSGGNPSDDWISPTANYSQHPVYNRSAQDMGATNLAAYQNDDVGSDDEEDFKSSIYQSYVSGSFNFGAGGVQESTSAVDVSAPACVPPEQTLTTAHPITSQTPSATPLRCDPPYVLDEIQKAADDCDRDAVDHFIPSGISAEAATMVSTKIESKDDLQKPSEIPSTSTANDHVIDSVKTTSEPQLLVQDDEGQKNLKLGDLKTLSQTPLHYELPHSLDEKKKLVDDCDRHAVNHFIPSGISSEVPAKIESKDGFQASSEIQDSFSANDRVIDLVTTTPEPKLLVRDDIGQKNLKLRDLEEPSTEGTLVDIDPTLDSSANTYPTPDETTNPTLDSSVNTYPTPEDEEIHDECVPVQPAVSQVQNKIHDRGTLRATKSEQSPVVSKKPKKTNRNLSSFLDRLQNQAKKKLEDDDKTETPEFMKLFKKIGGKNQNEAVLEASGEVTSRDAQRTSFEQLKLGHQKLIDPRKLEAPSKSWKPKKKKPTSDSESDDDSFAKSFMRGAKMTAPVSDSKSATLNRHNMSDSSESSDDDSFAKSFMKGAQMPSNETAFASDGIQSKTSDDDTNTAHNQVAGMESKETPQATPHHDSSSSSSSDSDAPTTKVQKNVSCKDSESSSSDDNSVPTKKQFASPISRGVQQDTSTYALPNSRTGTNGQNTSLRTKRRDSESSSSSSDSSAPQRSTGPLPGKQASQQQLNGSAAIRKAGLASKNSSSSENSSESESTKPNLAAPVQTADSSDDSSKSSLPPKVTQRQQLKTNDQSSSSSDDSSAESKKASPPRPVPATQRQPSKTKELSSSSSDDSSDESTRGPPPQKSCAPVVLQKPAPVQQRQSLKSKDMSSSSDDSSDGSTRAPPQKARAPTALKKQSDSSSDDPDDSSDESGAKPKPVSLRKQQQEPSIEQGKTELSSSDESSSSHRHDKSVGKARDSTKSKDALSSSDESASSDDEVVKTNSPIGTWTNPNMKQTSSDDESSSSSSDDGNKVKKNEPQKRNVKPTDDSSDSSCGEKEKPSVDSVSTKGEAPKTGVPDFAARLTQAAAMAKGKKKTAASRGGPKSDFIIKDGKVVRRGSIKAEDGGKKTKKIKVKLKKAPPNSPGSQVSSDNDSSPRRRPRRKSLVKDKKFEIKDGKLVRKKQEKSADAKTKKRASFKIVNGKLVKKDDESLSSQDSDVTEKA